MGKKNGLSVPMHVGMFTHPKTVAAAAELVRAGVRPAEAPLVVVGAVLRLSGWAISGGDTGLTGHLDDASLAIEAWPEAVREARQKPDELGALLRRALHATPPGFDCGYLDGAGDEEHIHDFTEHFAGILENRRVARTRRKSGPEPRAPRANGHTHDRENGREYDRTHDRTCDRGYPDPVRSDPIGSAAPPTPPATAQAAAAAAAAAPDPLLAEARTCLRWRGRDGPLQTALADLRAAGTPEDALRAALHDPGAVGLRPLTWRDRVLDARRGGADTQPLPPGWTPCERCAATGRVEAPGSVLGSMPCPRCDGRRGRAPEVPGAAERGYARVESYPATGAVGANGTHSALRRLGAGVPGAS